MKKNMGLTDSLIRIAIAVLVIALYFAHVISGIVAVVLLVLSVIFLITSIAGFCPLYTVFGISSCKKENKAT